MYFMSTCRQLGMLTLEEVDRLAIDLFILDCKADSIFPACLNITGKSEARHLSLLYNNCIRSFTTTDNRRLSIFEFTTMATKIRYWIAINCGDRMTMEIIQNKQIDVYLLAGKHKVCQEILG